jgi:hypothetical protein
VPEEALQFEAHAEKVYGSVLATGTFRSAIFTSPNPSRIAVQVARKIVSRAASVDKYERAKRVVIVKTDTDDD